jgi:DNA-binding transcriptional MerR regulator
MRDRQTFELITTSREPDMDGPKIRRLYYSAGEVCRLAGIKPHTLIAWENRFGAPKPSRNLNGRKLYRPGDLDATLRIKEAKDNGMSDEAVLVLLKKSREAVSFELVDAVHPQVMSDHDQQWMDEIQAGLEEIMEIIGK